MNWLIRVGDAISQLGNVIIFNGDPNYSISGDSYRFNKKWRIAFIDALFGEGHCMNAYLNDVAKAEKLLSER